MMDEVANNIKSTAGAILILLLVGAALAGTWLVSGIIPSMIYYGLQIPKSGYFYQQLCHLFYYFDCNWKFLDYKCDR
jgi:Na+/H+ antiporter NhaC